jgi:hypothetical protein
MKLLITLTEDDLRGKRMNFQLSYLDPFKKAEELWLQAVGGDEPTYSEAISFHSKWNGAIKHILRFSRSCPWRR